MDLKTKNIFADESGFSTFGMAIALLISIALVFAIAQVYKVQTASADVQEVADAAALAAENDVAEFMVVVRMCDAVVLSMTLTSLVVTGLGVVALCVPATSGLATELLDAADKMIKARDTFADKATNALNKLQKALPFICAVNAESISVSNNTTATPSDYFGIAILLPFAAKDISINDDEDSTDLVQDVKENENDIKEKAKEVEELSNQANEAKEIAYLHDCGNNPGYCMFERASTLANMNGVDNPYYHSVDTWSFSVAMQRAKAYYPKRLQLESPQSNSIDEQAKSSLRSIFYTYAVQQIQQGYVHDDGDIFDAYFPRLPKNTSQMRETSMYTQKIFPVTTHSKNTMHAWSGCPGAADYSYLGSIEEMELGDFEKCSYCEFSAASLGKVAAASTSIENGFEYHYCIVAEQAQQYQHARQQSQPSASEIKDSAKSWFDRIANLVESSCSKRIEVVPPGSYGAISIVVNLKETPSSFGFDNSFTKYEGVLGTRAAISGATIIEDTSDSNATVLSSFFDSFANENALGAGLDLVMNCWSGLLQLYSNGQDALSETIEITLSSVPVVGPSGLGTWASSTLKRTMQSLGLQPANLDALKPVLINTRSIADADSGGFAAHFLEIKAGALSMSGSSSDLFTSMLNSVEYQAVENLSFLNEPIELATIEPFGSLGPSIPITISLPASVRDASIDVVASIVNRIKSIVPSFSEIRPWE